VRVSLNALNRARLRLINSRVKTGYMRGSVGDTLHPRCSRSCLYKWATGVAISTDVTLSGGPDDVWIFQVAGPLNQASATHLTLAGGAMAKNIFWQVAGAVTIGSTSHFEGVVLGKTMIAVNTGASVNGRPLAQTAITLQMNPVRQ
jgi:Ice-binding-like